MKYFEFKIKIRQQQTTQNDLQRKKGNCQPDLEILKILLQAWYQSANFVKTTTSQMSAGTYKQGVTTDTKLNI